MDIEAIKKEIETLNQVIAKANKALYKCPEGSLRISYAKNRPVFFHRKEDGSEQYIKASENDLVKRLANKDYNLKIIREASKQKDCLEKMLKHYKPDLIRNISEDLHPIRKALITPYELSNKDYAEQWQNLKYEGGFIKEGSVEFRTSKGEIVRSKSEIIIADKLRAQGIPYRYEFPLFIKGIGVIHPDFTVLNIETRKEFIWEHFGMMDNADYYKKAMRKIQSYAENDILPGKNLIITEESSEFPLRTDYVDLIIRKLLKQG